MDDKTIFYIVGGVLALAAVVVSFIGIRDKDFPSSNRAGKIVLAIFGIGVIIAGGYAILAAREEQAERREHLAEAEHAPVQEGESDQQLAEQEESGDQAAGDEQVESEQQGEGGDELVTQGAEVFTAQGCASCHALTAADATGAVGPDLDTALAGQSSAQIEESIVDPSAEIADGFQDGVMPDNYEDVLTATDIEALVAYLEFAVSQS